LRKQAFEGKSLEDLGDIIHLFQVFLFEEGVEE